MGQEDSPSPERGSAPDRHLAAIMAADIAGYSRMMGQDEAATVRDLKAHMTVVQTLIAQHTGSVINIAADGILVQFPSAVRALECAVAIKKTMEERNFDVPADRKMLFRIGINLGDVVHDGTNVYGDGINIAARLQAFAKPGSICVSANVRDAIFGKIGLPLHDLGEKSFKNIARPVRTFEVQPEGTPDRRVWHRRPSRRFAGSLVATLLVIVVGLGAWQFWPRPNAPSDLPALVVLPFKNTSGDPTQDYFGPGVSQVIKTMLSSYPILRVVTAPEQSNDKSLADLDIGRAAGARYVLDGGVFKTSDKVGITAQLIDVTTGENVWGDRYRVEGNDPLALQDDIAQKVYNSVSGLFGNLLRQQELTAWRKDTLNLTEYDYYLRGTALLTKFTPEDTVAARLVYQEGLSRFPDFALMRVLIAWTLLNEVEIWGPGADCKIKTELAFKLTKEAEASSNQSRLLTYNVHWILASLYEWHSQDFDRAVIEAEAAVKMAPFDAQLRGILSYYLAAAGRLDQSIDYASWAIARDPNGLYYRENLAFALYFAGRNEEALVNMKGYEAGFPGQYAAILVRLGRLDEAKAVIAEWLKGGPQSVENYRLCWPIKEPYKSAYLDDLRKAGLPEK